MFSFFKKPKKKHLTKNSTFYHRENLIQNYSDLKNALLCPAKLTTNYPITYQGFPLESINPKNIEERFGEESYILEHEDVVLGHQVFFYRKNVQKFKLLIQIHYLDDVLFHISTKFSADSLLTANEKEKIVDQLLNNYPDIKLDKNNLAFSFMDSKGNRITTDDNVFFYVKYCPNNQDIQKLKAKVSGGKYMDTKQVEENNSLDKFI